jgi:hypothetical protein
MSRAERIRDIIDAANERLILRCGKAGVRTMDTFDKAQGDSDKRENTQAQIIAGMDEDRLFTPDPIAHSHHSYYARQTRGQPIPPRRHSPCPYCGQDRD